MLLTLVARSGQPLSRQLLDQLQERLEAGLLRPGQRLPSTRRLAEQLGIHRSTVAQAYQELWTLGWLDMRPGASPKVRARVGLAAAPRPVQAQAGFDWGRVCGPALEPVLTGAGSRGRTPAGAGISFTTLSMDARLVPAEAFRSCLNRVLRRKGAALLGYGAREGYYPLREYLAKRLAGHGIQVVAEEILITHGSQQALDLVFRMLGPGRTVAVEAPTYDQVLPLLELSGLCPVGVAMTPEGMDLDALGRLLATAPPALVYTMPNFQNPTGISTGQGHRERLLALCQAHQVPLLEDGFEEEMKYFGKVSLPIKSMDGQGLVIYAGTFSKVLFPGVRVGWIAAARGCVDRLAALRRFSELCPNPLVQAGVLEFCASGHYDLHLNRMHRIFRRRMTTLLQALRHWLRPEWAQWQEPQGGYLLWLRLLTPPGTAVDWPAQLSRHGVWVGGGNHHFPDPTPDTYIRLSISSLNEDEISEGVRRLGAALAQAHGMA